MAAGSPPRIALVGSGPTAIYTLARLIAAARPLHVTVYESGTRLGVGTPYDRRTNAPEMLANIASIELPPVTETLLEWIRRDGQPLLHDAGIDPAAIDDRTFLPRVILGDYFEAQVARLLAAAEGGPCAVEVLRSAPVVDIAASGAGPRVRTRMDGELAERTFDYAVVATGHQRPRERQAGGALTAYSAAPELMDARAVGILGTSLSAIDVAIGHAVTLGRFVEDAGQLRFVQHHAGDPRTIAMMSRSGILPEADFYCPIPYEPLDIFTAEAVDTCTDLDALYALFCRQLAASDPAYARSIDLAATTADTFERHYFAARKAVGALQWAEENMVEVAYNHANRLTVAWRYAILRMHEPFGAAVERLSDADHARFDRGLKKVFVDNYAAVPPLSIGRLLALRDAGVLEVIALTENYTLAEHDSGWHVTWLGGTRDVDALVDARGQRPLDHLEVSFPALRLQLHALSLEEGRSDDIAVDANFRLGAAGTPLGRVYFAALPFLLKRKPFIQGLTASREIGTLIADAILTGESPAKPADLTAELTTMLHELDNTSLIVCISPERPSVLSVKTPARRRPQSRLKC